jgi:hypothetical protein
MSEAEPAARLAPDQLDQLMALLQGADSVELKLTVPDGHQRSAVRALEMDPLEAELRQVFFFDTPDLALDSAGVVVRARRVQRARSDTVVKLRPVVPGDLPADVRRHKSFKVELDAMPGGFVCSASFKGRPDHDILEAVAGRKRISRLFSKEQRRFYSAHAPEGIELDDLTPLGPVMILKLRYTPKGLDRPLTVERWTYPDGTRILELSTKTTPGEAFQTVADSRAFLMEKGVPLDGEQQTKTRTALEFFSQHIEPASDGKDRRPTIT